MHPLVMIKFKDFSSTFKEDFSRKVEKLKLRKTLKMVRILVFGINTTIYYKSSSVEEILFKYMYHMTGPRETVCFVDPRPSMFPEAKPSETSTVEGPQNTLLSRGLSQ